MGAPDHAGRSCVKVYVIDGYNVLLSDARYRDLVARDIDTARAALIRDVASFVHGEADAVVVFDGASNPASDGELHDAGGPTVIFSPFGSDADSVIEQIVADRGATGDEVIVVTSDAQTQWVALGHGALRVSSAGFVRRVEETAAEHAGYGTERGGRQALDARIEPAVRDALARWARGEK